MDKETKERLQRFSADIRINTIRALAEPGFGHIGGSMSIADVLAVLYGKQMRIDPERPKWDDRDRLVLSKGHCGPALYATLALKGYFSVDELKSINSPHTRIPSHADARLTPGIDMTTGSLGQGISAAVGIALGNRIRGKDSTTYCIVGDGELQEGEPWEAMSFAAHHGLDRLVVLVDENKRQLDGWTEEINSNRDLAEKMKAFGLFTIRVPGNDVEAIDDALLKIKTVQGTPKAIILETEKGIGCNFAEQVVFNHYMNFDKKMAESAVAEIERRLSEGTYPGGENDD